MRRSGAGAAAVALTVSFAVGQPQIEPNLRAVRHPADETAPQTISVELLRQPLSRKAKQIFEKAQRAADAGDHVRAIGFRRLPTPNIQSRMPGLNPC